MMRLQKIRLLLFLVLLVAFGYGLVQLFQLRFASGDVYPEYSSLRADPLGVKAYYESLGRLGQPGVRRNLQAIDKLPSGDGTTLFVLGLPWSELNGTPEEFQKVESFVRNGGRVVIGLYPVLEKPFLLGRTSRPAGAKPRRGANAEDEPAIIEFDKAWGYKLGHVPLPKLADRSNDAVSAKRRGNASLPPDISWHAALVFTNLDAAWRVIYARDTNAVLIERSLGAGTIVLASDSYYASNEAMRKERHPGLLVWLLGANGEVIFNETHLGVMEDPGIATLARKYGLHGLFAALLALAGLFVWKNVASFALPDDAEQRDTGHVLGRDAAAGFVNLLRRSLAPKDLLANCWEEWAKSLGHQRRQSPARLAQAQAIIEAYQSLPPRERDPVNTYQALSRTLNDRPWKTATPRATAADQPK